jgi:hypothetical protein
MVESAFAQSIPKPSLPEFTLYLVNHYYDVPATTVTDPYSGNKTTYPGFRVNNITIDITIKNQPFTPYKIEDPEYGTQTVQLTYDIQVKGHFEDSWGSIYSTPELLRPSNSEYTVTYYSLANNYHEGQMDFQVEALIGYFHRIPGFFSGYVFNGTESGWSNTQTITIPDITAFLASSPAPTPTFPPTPSPTLTPASTPTPTPTPILIVDPNGYYLYYTMFAIVILAVAVVSTLFYFKKRKH